MADLLPPLLAIGLPLLLAVIGFVYFKHTMDGPGAPIVVVDPRTMRLAKERIAEAMRRGKVLRANAGLTALIAWLRYEVRTGPSRTRDGYVAELALAERQKDHLAELGHRS